MKKNKTIMLESKTYGQGFMFSYRYLTPESLVEYDEILRKTFKEYCIKHKLFPVRDIKIHHDPYYFYTHCVKVGCKNDDIDTCIREHDEFVRSEGPHEMVWLVTKTIPLRYKHMAEYFATHDTVIFPTILGDTKKLSNGLD